jgi:hypothetical protein
MDTLDYEARIAALEKENRILRHKLVRSETSGRNGYRFYRDM